MDMQKLIQQLTDLESNKQLNESIDECGETMPAPEVDKSHPVTVNMNVSATGKEHVKDLLDMMKNAGLSDAGEVTPDQMPAMPMRHDIETFRGAVDAGDRPVGEEENLTDVEDEEETFANTYGDEKDDAQYQDTRHMTRDLAGGLNREKDGYPKAQDGDNAMRADFRKKLEDRLKEMMKK